MLNVIRLRLGALLHFLIAVGHLICLFFLEEAFKAYGILDEMKHLCFGHEWLLYVVTVCLAVGFAIAGLYALSVAGDMRRLPLQRLVIIAIVSLYSIRIIIGIGWLLYEFTYLQFFSNFSASVTCLLLFPRIETSKESVRKRRGFFNTTLPISFQFHHVQMDGSHAARFLELLQAIIISI